MPSFTVKADISEQVAGLHELEKTQLPFVVAKTLTNVAQDSQQAVKDKLPGAFKLRNAWTQQGIRIKPASKKGANGIISADVHTDTANRATGAPDYLGEQETGGEKVVYGGHAHLAVPTLYLRQLAPGIIPDELRPKNLLGAVNGRYGRIRRTGMKGQIALTNQRLVKGFEFFIVTIRDGHPAVMGRQPGQREAYPFYLLISEAKIKKSGLEMVETVTHTVNERLPTVWQMNWRDARVRGFKVK